MLILLILISVALFLYGIYRDWEDEVLVVFIIGFIIKFVVLVVLLWSLISLKVIDEKIELYQNQNSIIEKQIETTVKSYMQHEKETYKDLKVDSYIMLVNNYPELKSDKLVQEQIEIYIENNKKILKLKERKINKTVYRWWIYFGK